MAGHPAGARWPLLPLLAVLIAASGCATRSRDISARPDDPAAYAAWPCARIFAEVDRVQARAADVAYAVDARVGHNMIALGLGVTVFWPALLAMRPDGEEAAELAGLKGRFEALQAAATQQRCGPPPTEMDAERRAMLPVQTGDRLVYEERLADKGPARQLGLKVAALRRDEIEFTVEVDGQMMAGRWRQDLRGNPVLQERAALIGWQRLLQPDLKLGQVVFGDLASSSETSPTARVRGQVVAIGPKEVSGRSFDVAVIELFGEAPAQSRSFDLATGTTRIDGVMAVDRRSGVLLRLELRCANPEFSLRRRLVAVESPAPPR